jgi:hypothetical protein
MVIAHDYAEMARLRPRAGAAGTAASVEAGAHAALLAPRGAYLALVERRHAA